MQIEVEQVHLFSILVTWYGFLQRTSKQPDPQRTVSKMVGSLSNFEENQHSCLPSQWKSIHPVFHISLLETVKTSEVPNRHKKGNIRLNPKFLVLDDSHIQGFLLGSDYQRMYVIDIYNSKSRHITIGTN
ncbi:hypothetical protein O181_108342 [Austropuccinia psidii MF-1]|uniref:Uncharacterized protein n=1 Tax=Austropuccinia psidii MF-1 TaxID=1389203 RepID=A0A9Q3PQA6_9BASI|nr:hypothetical protein [Austropuccinia psidii MF-1]